MSEALTLFSRLSAGEDIPFDDLLPLVYRELHEIATGYLRFERPGHTLQPTALVHEAFLRLVHTDEPGQWKSKSYFFAAAATSMRRILVDYARSKKRLRRGGDLVQIQLQDVPESGDGSDQASRLLALDRALTQLQHEDEQLAVWSSYAPTLAWT